MLFYSAVIRGSNNTIINFTLIITLGLTIKDLEKVKEDLKAAGFGNADWKELGGKLGLNDNTLKMIDKNERGDTDSCFRECLVKWLKRVDDVDTAGQPSLNSLAKALGKMNDCKDQAEYISECIITKTTHNNIIITLLYQAY